MNIINSIREKYEAQLSLNKRLEKKVEAIIKSKKKMSWHYFGRIKSEESFALKIETGRFPDLQKIEDFFACTIVVENSSKIKNAREFVETFCEIIEQRPRVENITYNPPESFRFEDLRLYVKLQRNPSLPEENPINELSNIIFEIQIKTFLQHAWASTIHGLIYKGNEVNWAQQRIAYQIKAMLEHVEISIQEIEQIKNSKLLAKSDKTIKQQEETRKFLNENWGEDKCPYDMIRLSQNVTHLLKQMNLSLTELQKLLDIESAEKRGIHTLNLSPFFVIIQTIINQKPSALTKYISDSPSKDKVVIPPEIDIKDLNIENEKIIQIKSEKSLSRSV